MTKKELSANVAKKAGVTHQVADSVINHLLDEIRDGINSGESFSFAGFGSFKPFTRSARKGFNPKTREEIEIPAKDTVKFTASKGFIND